MPTASAVRIASEACARPIETATIRSPCRLPSGAQRFLDRHLVEWIHRLKIPTATATWRNGPFCRSRPWRRSSLFGSAEALTW